MPIYYSLPHWLQVYSTVLGASNSITQWAIRLINLRQLYRESLSFSWYSLLLTSRCRRPAGILLSSTVLTNAVRAVCPLFRHTNHWYIQELVVYKILGYWNFSVNRDLNHLTLQCLVSSQPVMSRFLNIMLKLLMRCYGSFKRGFTASRIH